eukprot:4718229-Pyramimonas_sp.AAC.1
MTFQAFSAAIEKEGHETALADLEAIVAKPCQVHLARDLASSRKYTATVGIVCKADEKPGEHGDAAKKWLKT